MLYIGICDDEDKDLNLINDEITKTLFDVVETKVYKFHSGKEVIDAIERDDFKCNLLFLDVYMQPSDGMETAEYIRKNGIDVDIIFVTNSTEHVYKGYIYKAFSYILKPSIKETISEELKRYVEELLDTDECLNVKSEGVIRKIPISHIVYVESDARLLILHLKKEDVSFYGKLNELESLLADKGFVRTHQSYMVRKTAVTGMTAKELMLDDITVPISRKYYQSLKDIF
ncbi:MAG: response regulator transcription factor [Lachnospiraceae bacterium]|nr:response regulator transcription factor [Lachnospiraceae bacterium]